MSEHTSGPWTYEVEDDAHPFGYVRFWGLDGKVHLGYTNKQPHQMDRILADARLIASAPALLSTCEAQHASVEAMREWLNREQIDVPDDVLEALQEGRRQYKSVIAQVEGETP